MQRPLLYSPSWKPKGVRTLAFIMPVAESILGRSLFGRCGFVDGFTFL